jgi:hypothetical protein
MRNRPALNTPKVTGFVFIFCSLKHIQRTSEGLYFMILEVSERNSLWIRNKSEKSAKFCLILGQILWNMKPWNLKLLFVLRKFDMATPWRVAVKFYSNMPISRDRSRPGLSLLSPRHHTKALGTRLQTPEILVKLFLKIAKILHSPSLFANIFASIHASLVYIHQMSAGLNSNA